MPVSALRKILSKASGASGKRTPFPVAFRSVAHDKTLSGEEVRAGATPPESSL